MTMYNICPLYSTCAYIKSTLDYLGNNFLKRAEIYAFARCDVRVGKSYVCVETQKPEGKLREMGEYVRLVRQSRKIPPVGRTDSGRIELRYN